VRYFSYVETEDEVEITKIVYSEQEILDEFWEYWCTEMRGNGYADLISRDACIDDWCTIHWASPEDVFIFKTGYDGKVFMVNEFNIQDPTFNLCTVVCLNDNSVKIDRFVHLEREMIRYV
jgi:hypothetical protein